MKAMDLFFSTVLFIVSYKYVVEILKGDHSNINYSAALYCLRYCIQGIRWFYISSL